MAGESSLPSTSLALGIDTLETSNQSIAGGIRRRLPTGTGYEVATVLQRDTDNTPLQRFNPALGPALSLSLSQNLLKNFGTEPNTAALRLARNDTAIAHLEFRNRGIGLVSEIEILYGELVFSLRNLAVKRASLALAQDFLRRTVRQIDTGMLPETECFQVEASVASRQADVLASAASARAIWRYRGQRGRMDSEELPIDKGLVLR